MTDTLTLAQFNEGRATAAMEARRRIKISSYVHGSRWFVQASNDTVLFETDNTEAATLFIELQAQRAAEYFLWLSDAGETQSVSRSSSSYACLRGKMTDKLRAALQAAHHAFQGQHGCWATDKPIFCCSMEHIEGFSSTKRMRDEKDSLVAHPNTYWRIDNSEVLKQIEEAPMANAVARAWMVVQ